MSDEQIFVPRAHAAGHWGGTEIRGDARVRVHHRGLVLAWHDGRGEWRVPFTEVAGVSEQGDTLVLHSFDGSVSLTIMQQLPALREALLARAFALPELARGARSVGSRRGGDPQLQARFFTPLLEARRRAEQQFTAADRVKALDARTIVAQTAQLLDGMARARWPTDLPEQRALGAQLEECCGAMFAACDALDARAREWLGARDEVRLQAWRDWVAAAAHLFNAADQAWGRVAACLRENAA
jgi:hypothetical protein